MIIGMDFGTTNSGMAAYDGHTLTPIPLSRATAAQAIDRTALYITNDHAITIGRMAIDRYLEQNVGRPTRIQRVRVGTIEVVASDIAKYDRDVYIDKDVLSPGRLLLSFKSSLST